MQSFEQIEQKRLSKGYFGGNHAISKYLLTLVLNIKFYYFINF